MSINRLCETIHQAPPYQDKESLSIIHESIREALQNVSGIQKVGVLKLERKMKKYNELSDPSQFWVKPKWICEKFFIYSLPLDIKTNFEFIVGESVIPVNRGVLENCSEYFKKFMQFHLKENSLRLTDENPEVIRAIFQYMMDKFFPENNDLLFYADMYTKCHEWQLDELLQKLFTILKCKISQEKGDLLDVLYAVPYQSPVYHEILQLIDGTNCASIHERPADLLFEIADASSKWHARGLFLFLKLWLKDKNPIDHAETIDRFVQEKINNSYAPYDYYQMALLFEPLFDHNSVTPVQLCFSHPPHKALTENEISIDLDFIPENRFLDDAITFMLYKASKYQKVIERIHPRRIKSVFSHFYMCLSMLNCGVGDIFQEVIKLDGSGILVLYTQLELYRHSGTDEEYAGCVNKILKHHPHDYMCLVHKGIVSYRNKDMDSLTNVLEGMSYLLPSQAYTYLLKGYAFHLEGKINEAIEMGLKALQKEANFLEGLKFLVEIDSLNSINHLMKIITIQYGNFKKIKSSDFVLFVDMIASLDPIQAKQAIAFIRSFDSIKLVPGSTEESNILREKMALLDQLEKDHEAI